MGSRPKLVVAGLLLALVGGYVAVDVWVETDEERLEALVDLGVGTMDPERLDAALGWTDPGTEPLEVTFRGQTKLYGRGEAATLRSDARDALRPLMGDDLRVLGSSIDVDGDAAWVTMRLMSGLGLRQVEVRLARSGDRWLANRVVVR